MRSKNTVKINFIRHGKTDLNEKHCYIGVTDSALSENGAKEIIEKKERGIYPNSELVFVSPMRRCIETATLIYEGAEKTIIEQFREMDFGSFEGKCYDELKDNLYYRRWIDESAGATKEELLNTYGELRPACEEGIILPEKKIDFTKRAVEGLKKVLSFVDGYDSVSVVTHGGIIMAVISELLSDDYYKYMISCGDGIETETEYTNDNGNIKISHFCINNRIRA